MVEKMTRLAYIMSRLGVRAEEVSRRTGIDKTLLSRWKNGQRRLSPVSGYSRDIGSFLLSLDNAESVIAKTLNAYGLDESNGSLQDNFVFWLTEQEFPRFTLRNAQPALDSMEYTASFRVFLGRDGLRSAILTLIDYVMTLPPPQNIVAVALSDFEWIVDDPAFFDLLVERLSVAFEWGVTLTLISRENFHENVSRFAALWLAAHLKGYIKSYYYKEGEYEGQEILLMAVKDGVCLRLEHEDTIVDGIYTDMYTDNVTVAHLFHNCMQYFPRANMQFRYGFFDKPGDFLKKVNCESMFASDCYLCAKVPTLGSIYDRQAHLYVKETVRDSKQRTEQVKVLFNTPDQYQPTAKVRHIYCLDSMEDLLAPGRTVDYPLSTIYGKRVHHSHRRVLEQLEYMRGWLQTHENYEVAFVPAHIFAQIPLEYMCVKDNFCAGWLADSGVSTCVKDVNKVAALFGYAEQLWEKLPKYCKERRRSIRQLTQWIDAEN